MLANHIHLQKSRNYVDADVAAKLKGTIIPAGTVVFAKIGEALRLNRRAITACDCLIDNNAMGIRANSTELSPKYFFYFMKNLDMSRFASATTAPSVRKSILENLQIKLPSYEEQETIAVKLDILHDLIVNRKRVLALLDELVKSRFVEMFGDPVLNTKHWECHSLSQDILFLTSGSRGWSSYFSNDGEIFVTIKNVKNGHITLDDVQYVHAPDNAEAKRTKVQAGDLLISITADLGRTGIVSEELAARGAYINQHLTCIRLKQSVMNPLYVALFMESDGGKRQFEAKNQTGVKAGLNFDAIKSLEVLVPPLPLQQKFAAFVREVDAAKAAARQEIAALETLRGKMMQEFFG